jgi:hypothetical protein
MAFARNPLWLHSKIGVTWGERATYMRKATSNHRTLDDISAFFHDEFHQRMWVALELAYSKNACLVVGNAILSNEDKTTDSFFVIADRCRDEFRRITEDSSGMELVRSKVQRHWKDVTYIRKKENPSFGEVFSLIAQKNCYYNWDRYLAIASFLELGTPEELYEQFRGKKSDVICEWVRKRCLEKGDCGPLLLVESPCSKPKNTCPNWITGCKNMRPELWGLGRLLHSQSIRLCDNVSDPLLLTLESVGFVTRVRFVNTYQDRNWRPITVRVILKRVGKL